MTLSQGIVIENESTFGRLRFSAYKGDKYGKELDESGNQVSTEEVVGRSYDLKSSAQGKMIQVTVTGNLPVKEFPYDGEVKLIEPELIPVSNTRGQSGAVSALYLRCKDLELVKGVNPAPNPGIHKPEEQKK